MRFEIEFHQDEKDTKRDWWEAFKAGNAIGFGLVLGWFIIPALLGGLFWVLFFWWLTS